MLKGNLDNMLSIVKFLVTLVAGLIAAANFAHKGMTGAGEAKKKWVLDQLSSILAVDPVITGVNATLISAVMSVVRYLVPMFGGTMIDWTVKTMNSNGFFVSIETYVAEALDLLNNGFTTTPKITPTTPAT